MKMKVILAVVLVILLMGAAVADAKGKSGGAKSAGSGSKSFSTASGATSSVQKAGTLTKAVGAAVVTSAATKKHKLDVDDIFENETEDDPQSQQSPGFEVVSAALGIGALIALRGRKNRSL